MMMLALSSRRAIPAAGGGIGIGGGGGGGGVGVGSRRSALLPGRRRMACVSLGALGFMRGSAAFFAGGGGRAAGLTSWSALQEGAPQARQGGQRGGTGAAAAAAGGRFLLPRASVVTSVKARRRHAKAGLTPPSKEDFIPYRTYGDPSKQPVVIVPGLDGATAFFSDVLPELTLNFHVVMFNLPLVPRPFTRAASEGEDYDMSYIAKRLAEVMDDAGIEGGASIVGESFGGMVAQRLALDFPDKVDRLVLLSSLAKPDLTPIVRFKANFILPVVEGIGFLLPFVAQSLFAVAHLPDVVEKHEPRWAKRVFLKEASFAHHWSVMARTKIALSFDTTDELKDIKTGALVLYGEDDTFTATGAQQLLDGIEGSRTLGLPGGHLCHITSPKTFSKVVTEYLLAPP